MFSPTRLVGLAEQDLFKLNMLLQEQGLPFYYEGGRRFNTSYRMAPAPRFVGKWFPPFLKLSELYLSYWKEDGSKIDIVYSADHSSLKIISVNQ